MERPSQPRETTPSWIKSSAMRLAMLMGMAKEMPWYPPDRDQMLELMPITWPFRFTSGPPELPGFTAASVWM